MATPGTLKRGRPIGTKDTKKRKSKQGHVGEKFQTKSVNGGGRGGGGEWRRVESVGEGGEEEGEEEEGGEEGEGVSGGGDG